MNVLIQARKRPQDRAAAARILICVVIQQETNAVSPKKTNYYKLLFSFDYHLESIQEFEGLRTAIIPCIYLSRYLYHVL